MSRERARGLSPLFIKGLQFTSQMELLYHFYKDVVEIADKKREQGTYEKQVISSCLLPSASCLLPPASMLE